MSSLLDLIEFRPGGRPRQVTPGVVFGADFRSARMTSQVAYAHLSYAKPAGLRGHIGYLEKDGKGKNGGKPVLFTAKGREVHTGEVKGEPRYFRLIISPEPPAGEKLNLQSYTRDIMRRLERQYSARLEWFAAEHHETGKPHVHIVIRGLQPENRARVGFDPEFIKTGIREIASKAATRQIGERSPQEVRNALINEANLVRYTSIDRRIRSHAEVVRANRSPEDAREKERARIDQHDMIVKTKNPIELRRLEVLSKIPHPRGGSLAYHSGRNEYTLRAGWVTELRTCERIETMITQLKRTIRHDYANMRAAMDPNETMNPRPTEMHIYAPTMGAITGTVVRKDVENELTDKPFIVVRTDTGYYYCSNRPGFDQVREGQTVTVNDQTVIYHRAVAQAQVATSKNQDTHSQQRRSHSDRDHGREIER